VVAVRTDFPVRVGRMATSPVWRADARLHSVPRWPWRTVRRRRGTKGWLHKKFVAVRGWRVTSDGHGHEGWLLGERAARGQPEEPKDSWSNLPASASLEELAGYAHRRQAIEPFHEEAKGELGWDQYQGRLWPGFHRHAVTVMLASSFLVWLERRQRSSHTGQGRRSDRFPPSAKAPAHAPASRAS
jgi:SRSO17 transposase